MSKVQSVIAFAERAIARISFEITTAALSGSRYHFASAPFLRATLSLQIVR